MSKLDLIFRNMELLNDDGEDVYEDVKQQIKSLLKEMIDEVAHQTGKCQRMVELANKVDKL